MPQLPAELLKPPAALEILDADAYVGNRVLGKGREIRSHELGASLRLAVLRLLVLEWVRQEGVDALFPRSAMDYAHYAESVTG